MFIMLRRLARVAVGLPLILAIVIAHASAGEAPKINVGPDRVAIKGYDTVAYFTIGQPVQGEAQFEYEWQGAKWRFAKAEHRDLFSANPDKYAPRFGGLCAVAMSLGMQVAADPLVWTIVDGKLYLNYDKPTLEEFNKDPPSHIAKADVNWNKVVQGN